MNAVYVDTSSLLSLLDRDDQDHLECVRALESLVAQESRLVTCSYVLVEAGALARGRLGFEVFRRLGETVDRSIDVFWVDESLHQRALLKTTEPEDQGLTLVDWTGILLMQDMGITTALATDPRLKRLAALADD